MASGGPYSAQIQRAIAALLAGNNTWTGTNTFSGGAVIPSFTGVNSITFSGGQALTGSTADVTTLARSTNDQRFVLGLATTSYPALLRSGTGIKFALGDGSVALGWAQVGRGTAAAKALRFVRGNDTEEATFGFHVDTVDANNLIFGVSNVNRVVLSNAALLGIHIASDASFNFASTTNAASGTYDLRLTRSAASTLHVLGAAGADVAVVKANQFQATGAVAIGNTVAAGVGVASTHKVTMVIGGVTYYLLASNV